MLEYNFMCAARCRGYSSIARRNAEQLIPNYYLQPILNEAKKYRSVFYLIKLIFPFFSNWVSSIKVTFK